MNRLALVVVSLLASLAVADVSPPNSQGCTNKVAGDSCLDDSNVTRTCAASTCRKLDYSHGTPPGSIVVPCLICGDAADAGPVSSSTGGGVGGGGGGGGSTPPKTGCTAVPGVLLAGAALFFALRTGRR